MTDFATQRAAWLLRLWVAVLLFFGSDILLWMNPPGRSTLDWVAAAVAYIALAAALLDTIVRYRVRGINGILLLAGLYALAMALMVNPELTLSNVPRTLASRVLGGHTLGTLFILWLLLTLTGGTWRYRGAALVAVSGAVGLVWGVWVNRFPVVSQPDFGQVSFGTMLLYGGVALLLVAGFLLLNARSRDLVSHIYLRLSFGEASAVGVALIILFVRGAENDIVDADSLTLPAVILLGVYCAIIIWYLKREQGEMLLDGHVPVRLPPLLWLVLAAGLFIGMGAVGYGLPNKVGPLNFYTGLAWLFNTFGALWLPLLSINLGVRALVRQTQTSGMG